MIFLPPFSSIESLAELAEVYNQQPPVIKKRKSLRCGGCGRFLARFGCRLSFGSENYHLKEACLTRMVDRLNKIKSFDWFKEEN